MVFENLAGQLAVAITFGFGVLLIVLFPLIKKESRFLCPRGGGYSKLKTIRTYLK